MYVPAGAMQDCAELQCQVSCGRERCRVQWDTHTVPVEQTLIMQLLRQHAAAVLVWHALPVLASPQQLPSDW